MCLVDYALRGNCPRRSCGRAEKSLFRMVTDVCHHINFQPRKIETHTLNQTKTNN